MSDKFFFKGRKTPKPAYGMSGYNTKRVIKPGTASSPINVTVKSEQRQAEIQAIATEHDIAINITIAESEAEYLIELNEILNKPTSVEVAAKQNRNELCACKSGKKFKKCCGKD
ncbi:zinc chelation protein SecC [Shewanella sp. OPT22]|nr:zinc chelation protein SecC [Shewanella sp. OPT22]